MKVSCRLKEYECQPEKIGSFLPVFIGFMILTAQTFSYFGESLWIDETITAWVVRDNLIDVFTRATEFQGQSPLYFMFPWAFSKVFGLNEWSLRFPSFLFNIITVLALFNLFTKLVSREVAGYAAGMFALTAAFSGNFLCARPYALGVSFFATSLVLLEKWTKTARWSGASLFALSVAGMLYSHYLFALALPLYALVVLYTGNSRVITPKHIAGAMVLLAILMIPGVWQIKLLSSKTQLYSFAPTPSIESWISMFRPAQLTIYITLIFTAISLAKRELSENKIRQYATPLILVCCIWWYPSFALAITSVVMKSSVFLNRYALYSIVGESLAQGILLCSIRDVLSRGIAFMGAAIVGLAIQIAEQPLFAERWREALADIPRENSPHDIVLMWSGLVETREPTWVRDPSKRPYLLAPTAIYPVGPKVVPLPYFLNQATSSTLFTKEDQIAIDNARRIFVVSLSFKGAPLHTRDNSKGTNFTWLGADREYVTHSRRDYGGITVVELVPHN